ncbi:unnamed protein product [Prunus armeniaca]|uniref:Uncharacterized protein n=1 Tax=Prunus armeniaca TaxID=36596 RepID=A0A6J5VT80_PRUAR|nr:unnamed protein product [Prunus armeniaca]
MSSSATASSTVATMATYSLPNITHLVTLKLNDVGCKTSASMWSLISKYFTHKSTANSSYLRRRLNEISRRTRSVLDYLQEAKSISDQQASIGEPISNIDLVNTVLRGLGDEYEMLVTTLDSLDTLPDLVLYDLIF